MVTGKHVDKNPNSPTYGRHLLPVRDTYCKNCNSLMWLDERLKSSSKKNPKFGICCLQGAIELQQNLNLPDTIKSLLTSDTAETKQFRNAIRLYNSILAFTSVSANVDEKLLAATSGVYTYRINGAMHHKLSDLIPNNGQSQKFSQIYILDADLQSTHRSGMYPKAINANILNIIQTELNKNNPYVQIYQQAGIKLRENPSMELNIVLKSKKVDRTFNKPSSDEIAVLMIDDDQATISTRDIIVKKKNASEDYPLQFINENTSFYDALGYPIMHVHGESGWQYQTYYKKTKEELKSKNNLLNQNLIDEENNTSIGDNVIENHLPLDFYDFLECEEELEIDLDIDLEGVEPNSLRKSKYISAREFYAYRLQDRIGIYKYVHLRFFKKDVVLSPWVFYRELTAVIKKIKNTMNE